MKENDYTINLNSPSFEEINIDDLVSIYPNSDNFNDHHCSPCTFAQADCCGDSSPGSITIDPCKIAENKDIQAELECQGRLLTIRVVLKSVCPNKKIAIGVILFEGNKVRGFKVKEIVSPPLPTVVPGVNCENVVICKFCFVLPGSICCPLTLKPKVIAHYTNFNIEPCLPVCPPNSQNNH